MSTRRGGSNGGDRPDPWDLWDGDERQALGPVRDELNALRQRHANDPPLDELRAAAAGVLPEDVQRTVTNHLETSAWSRALVEGAEAADAALDDERVLHKIRAGLRPSEGAARRARWVWPAILAAAAAFAIGAFILRQDRPRPAVATMTPAPEPPAVSAPPSRQFHIPLDKPAVKLTALALTVRGDRSATLADALGPALDAYRADDYATAARELSALQPRFPASVEVAFYLGVSRLFLGDAAGGVEALESARRIGDPSFRADVDWYLGAAYERAGRAADARSQLEAICRGGDAYAARACAATPNVGRQ